MAGAGCLWAAARELRCDVAVIGGGTGGVAAALAALRNGMRVVMTEETDWVGGAVWGDAVISRVSFADSVLLPGSLSVDGGGAGTVEFESAGWVRFAVDA